MEIFFNTRFEKDKNKIISKNQRVLLERLENVTKYVRDSKTIEDLYKLKTLGFKKYQGIDKAVYGIDLGLNASTSTSAERIIVSFIESKAQKKYFEKYLSGNEIGIMFHAISSHDSQYKTASSVYIKENDKIFYLPKDTVENCENSINLKDKYEKLVYYDDFNKPRKSILTSDKHEIIDSFIVEPFPTIISGIAGSGKTVLMIELIEDITKFYPDKKILYVTFSDNLQDDVYKKSLFDKTNVEFKSLKGLLRMYCGSNAEFENMDTFKEFSDYYRRVDTNVNYNLQKEIINVFNKYETHQIYSEIYGILTGCMLKNWNRKSIDIISFDEYISLPNDYKVFKYNELKTVYELTKLYLGYLKEKNIHSFNMESMKIINENKQEKYDFILVDEVQDLTEVQIRFLFSLLRDKNNFVLAGDPNQVINPTFFKIGNLESLFEMYKLKRKVSEPLMENFRNSVAVTNLINDVNVIRNEWLPKRKEKYSQSEKSYNNSVGTIYHYIGDECELADILDSANVYMIVTNKEYDRLLESGKPISSNIMTIQEAKGIEFDHVILKNVLTDYKEELDGMFLNEKSSNGLLEYYFNLFYVGVTRTKYNLVLIENGKTKLFEKILKNHGTIESAATKDDLALEYDKSAAGFYASAERMFKAQMYVRAKELFNKALLAEDSAMVDSDMIKKYINVSDIYSKYRTDKELAEEFEKREYYDYALKHYRLINEDKKIIILEFLESDNRGNGENEIAFKQFIEECKTKKINIFDYYNYKNERYNDLLDTHLWYLYQTIETNLNQSITNAKKLQKKPRGNK